MPHIKTELGDIGKMYLDYRNYIVSAPLIAGAAASFLGGLPALGVDLVYGALVFVPVTAKHRATNATIHESSVRSQEMKEAMERKDRIKDYLNREFSEPPSEVPYHRLSMEEQRRLIEEDRFNELEEKAIEWDTKVGQLLPDSLAELIAKIQKEGLSPQLIELGREEPLYRGIIIWATEDAGIEPPIKLESM